MKYYMRLSEASDGRDRTIKLPLSTICNLLDSSVMTVEKRDEIAEIVEQQVNTWDSASSDPSE